MIPVVDYHMHTSLCGHAVGQPEKYAEYALKIGLEEIGFSDHAPLVAFPDPSVAMDFNFSGWHDCRPCRRVAG